MGQRHGCSLSCLLHTETKGQRIHMHLGPNDSSKIYLLVVITFSGTGVEKKMNEVVKRPHIIQTQTEEHNE